MNPMTETYLLASKARAKLTREASRPDHDLRVLVCHANMLDNLMDRIHEHRTSILNGDYLAKRLQLPQLSPSITHVSYIAEELDEDDDEEYYSDEDEQEPRRIPEIHYNTSEIEYDSESDSEEDFDIDSDDDEETPLYSIKNCSYEHYTPSRNFREMPSMSDLTDEELDDLEEMDSASDDEEQEVDIVDLNKTPSLTYTDSESDDDDDEHHHHHHHHSQPHRKHHTPLIDQKMSSGDLNLECLTMHSNFTTSEIVAM